MLFTVTRIQISIMTTIINMQLVVYFSLGGLQEFKGESSQGIGVSFHDIFP